MNPIQFGGIAIHAIKPINHDDVKQDRYGTFNLRVWNDDENRDLDTFRPIIFDKIGFTELKKSKMTNPRVERGSIHLSFSTSKRFKNRYPDVHYEKWVQTAPKKFERKLVPLDSAKIDLVKQLVERLPLSDEVSSQFMKQLNDFQRIVDPEKSDELKKNLRRSIQAEHRKELNLRG